MLQPELLLSFILFHLFSLLLSKNRPTYSKPFPSTDAQEQALFQVVLAGCRIFVMVVMIVSVILPSLTTRVCVWIS